MAEEDVTVSYQSVPTASFNLETREITLPIWKNKSEDVMDMMSLHEVGHALYTTMDLMKNGKDKGVEHSFINVLDLIDCWLLHKKPQLEMDFNS